ncbi:MAG: hypothetical protein IJK35_07720 [Oscillospiraceae bacterium]|nr:hypothetical protein [Oscillospiraceae bacterium]
MPWNQILHKLAQFKYPLLILALGLLLMMMPGGKDKQPENDAAALFQQALSEAEGVGDSRVLISEHGVLVVCEGGDSAGVKLDIIRAVGSYTGFGSDRITILKMMDH